MLVELTRVTTADGCRLDGIWQAPPPETAKRAGLDGVLLVHGTGGNFYSSTLLEFFSERFLSLGVGTLRVNTRGHDGISTASTSAGGKRLGAAYETVDDQRLKAKHPHLATALVEGADHFYTDCRDQAWRRIETWLCDSVA